MEEHQNHQDKKQSQRPLEPSDCGCQEGNPMDSKVRKDIFKKRMEFLEQLKKQLSGLRNDANAKETGQKLRAHMETLLKLPSENQRHLEQRSTSKPNEITPDENQEQEIGVMAPTLCCSGCIQVDPANGCSVELGGGTATGFHSLARGGEASGDASHAEGNFTFATGLASHAEGRVTRAEGIASHSEGESIVIGETILILEANGRASHAEGQGTRAEAVASHAEGLGTTASGVASHAEGEGFIISGVFKQTQAIGEASHAAGQATSANGVASHTEGRNTTTGVDALAGHAEGVNTTASGVASHAEGDSTTANLTATHAEGISTLANSTAAHAEGRFTTASGEASHAEGSDATASGNAAHAEGNDTTASGNSSHSEGFRTTASGVASHAEGEGFIISGVFKQTQAIGEASHAEGQATTANGEASHTEGRNTITGVNALAAHAEGVNTTASGVASHAEGESTDTAGFAGAHIMGKFGNADAAYSWFLANGTSALNKGLAAKILTTGIGVSDRGWRGGGADYAEMFETVDGKPIDVGYFVTLEGEKLRKANENDDYILGIVSADPAILADSGELRWKDKYVTDEWDRVQYHDVVIQAEKDKDRNVIVPERIEKQPILNPDWDPAREYIPRTERPEWVPVGLLGKLLVRDDGTCQVDGFCKPNDEGIATVSNKGYRVMKRTSPNQILVLFK